MDIKKNIFSENIKEIESLIEKKFKKELKLKFGHSNFPFNVKNTKINKFRRVFVSAVLDERIIEENEEVNYTGLSESRIVKKSDIDIFTYKRDNCIIDNVGKAIEYRVDNTNQTQSCGTCRGIKQITCDTCSGSGKNRCDGCNGQRKVKCSNCYGRGEVNCNIIFGCGGKGYSTSSENGRQVRKTCSSCNGRGKDPCSSCNNGYNTCSTCNGNGEVGCYTCNSNGKVDCYSCDAQGSFTKYLSVRSVLIKKDNDLVVEGNNPGDFISQNILAEQFSFKKDFIKYQISELREYKPQLKELFNGLLPGNNQQGSMIYASLDECASLTFEIAVGETAYIGGFKNGMLWFDDSIMNLLFFDMIDGLNVKANFNNLVSNKIAFQSNLNDTKSLWKSIEQYHKLEKIIESNDSNSVKIDDVRELNLLNSQVYLNYLYKNYRKKLNNYLLGSTLASLTVPILISGILNFDGLISILDILWIPILALAISVLLISYLIKIINPLSTALIGWSIIVFGFFANTNNATILYEKTDDLRYINSKKDEFSNYKKNNIVLSREKFKSIIGNNSINAFKDVDSLILISPTDDLKYDHFLSKGSYYTLYHSARHDDGECTGHRYRLTEQLILNLNHEEFLKNRGYYTQSSLKIMQSSGFLYYDVNPKDIKFKESKYGVSVMKNNAEHYLINKVQTYFFNHLDFVTFFPNSNSNNTFNKKYSYFSLQGKLITSNLNELDQINLDVDSNGFYNDNIKYIDFGEGSIDLTDNQDRGSTYNDTGEQKMTELESLRISAQKIKTGIKFNDDLEKIIAESYSLLNKQAALRGSFLNKDITIKALLQSQINLNDSIKELLNTLKLIKEREGKRNLNYINKLTSSILLIINDIQKYSENKKRKKTLESQQIAMYEIQELINKMEETQSQATSNYKHNIRLNDIQKKIDDINKKSLTTDSDDDEITEPKIILNDNLSNKIDDYYEVYNTYLDEEDYLNLRSEPTSKSTTITRMSDGTKLILLSKGNGSNGKWMKVRVLESGKVGYAHTKWIRMINDE